MIRALAALVVATIAACGVRPGRRTLPSVVVAAHVAPVAVASENPCGTYPDMGECQEGKVQP